MSALLWLICKSAWSRRLSLGLTLLAMTLAASPMIAVERVHEAARTRFFQSISGVDLIVGARASPLSLTLYSVFHLGDAVDNLEWKSYEAIAAHPEVAWSVPLLLGDSHRGFTVLGTTPDYFAHYRYGNQYALRLAEGQMFTALFDVVLGAEVAAKLGYGLGRRITLTHGSASLPGLEHGDKPFVVRGILAPTGTPADRTLFVSLAAIEAIHLDWQGGAPIPGFSIPAEQARKFDLQPKTLTAFLVGIRHRASVFRLQREISAFPDEALTAALPGIVLEQLWQSLDIGERLLTGLSFLMLGAGLIGVTAMLFASQNERRRELAILRAAGASRRHLLFWLMFEATALGCASALASLLLVALAAGLGDVWGAPYGLSHLPLAPSSWVEIQRLLLLPLATALASLAPAWQASRRALADGLTPRG
jgi:putative ABC transport system permease protein